MTVSFFPLDSPNVELDGKKANFVGRSEENLRRICLDMYSGSFSVILHLNLKRIGLHLWADLLYWCIWKLPNPQGLEEQAGLHSRPPMITSASLFSKSLMYVGFSLVRFIRYVCLLYSSATTLGGSWKICAVVCWAKGPRCGGGTVRSVVHVGTLRGRS